MHFTLSHKFKHDHVLPLSGYAHFEKFMLTEIGFFRGVKKPRIGGIEQDHGDTETYSRIALQELKKLTVVLHYRN